jgi:3'-phosphoadenosine 5'-phosphosulfate sulfotransferase (PAPS reductase)/FAD synthetase
VQPGEDIRAGRWWWEMPEQKECGLHLAKPGAPPVRISAAPADATARDGGEAAAG